MTNSRIWRDSNAVPVVDIVHFNSGVIPDATGSINQSNITLTSAVGVNEKPKAKLDELQDTGFSSLTFQLTGFISDPSNSLIPNVIKGWLIDDKQTSSFPLGRFGLQLDDFPAYNIRPNTNRGIFLTEWIWIRAGETKGKAEFTATLRFNANNTGLNSPSYNWNTT